MKGDDKDDAEQLERPVADILILVAISHRMAFTSRIRCCARSNSRSCLSHLLISIAMHCCERH